MIRIFLILFLNLPIFLYAQNESITLKLAELEEVQTHFRASKYKDVLREKCGEGVEAWSDSDEWLLSAEYHPFIQATHNAFAYHKSLSISPDMIWLMISQGFSLHVNQNSDSLKHLFVDFDGKKVINVVRDNFIKGSNANEWEGVFPEFTEKIAEFTGQELLDNTILEFSTTGVAEKAAFEITLMEATSKFFVYAMTTSCGIPEITLEGTTKDWEQILEKTKTLRKYGLEWWIDDLIPILEEFVNASKGEINIPFWQEIYKSEDRSSGTALISGWVLHFFPYVVSNNNYRRATFRGASTTSFPTGLSKVNFYWIYYGKTYQMEFYAGFIGVSYDYESKQLRPEIAWAVRDSGQKGIKGTDAIYKDEILNPKGKN